MNKTLRGKMGLRDSIGGIKIGDTVRIKANGRIGVVKDIGRHGLLDIKGMLWAYHPAEVETIDKEKEPSETAI